MPMVSPCYLILVFSPPRHKCHVFAHDFHLPRLVLSYYGHLLVHIWELNCWFLSYFHKYGLHTHLSHAIFFIHLWLGIIQSFSLVEIQPIALCSSGYLLQLSRLCAQHKIMKDYPTSICSLLVRDFASQILVWGYDP